MFGGDNTVFPGALGEHFTEPHNVGSDRGTTVRAGGWFSAEYFRGGDVYCVGVVFATF